MTTPGTPRDEAPLDEHLRTALRHAPDHGLSAPARLSQTILAAAAQVHRPARAAAAPEPEAPRIVPERQVPWREALRSLLAPRWAGSIAAGLVAALVVGLWYGEEVPQPVHDERVASGSVPAPAPAPAPEPARPTADGADRAPVAGPAPPRAADQPSTATPPAPAAPAPPAAVAPPKPAAAVAPPVATRKADGQVAERRAELANAQTEAPPSPARSDAAADSAPIAETTPGIARETAKSGGGLGPAPPARDAQTAAPAPSQGPAAALRRAPSATDAATVRAEPPARETVLSLAPQGPAAASPALTLLRRVGADAESRSAIWTWQPETGATARSFDDVGLAWLQRLVYAARGRWIDVSERSDGAIATEVRWWRNDEPTALLRIEARGLRWIEPSQRIRYAPMSADELARLNPPR